MVTESGRGSQVSTFSERLRARAREINSWLCVGLDPDLAWLPPHLSPDASGVVSFCRDVIDATAEHAVCFKVNFAFFEALGPFGWEALAEVRGAIPAEVPVIADAKRGDIGNTDEAYARAILDVLDFDAVTVSPYLGSDSVLPFASRESKCALALCKTSNSAASELQDLPVDGVPLFMRVARHMLSLECTGEIGLVVGATQPDALRRVRALSSTTILLVPGVGAQGATVQLAIGAGANERGENALASVSRQILCASAGRDFAAAARREAADLARQTRETA